MAVPTSSFHEQLESSSGTCPHTGNDFNLVLQLADPYGVPVPDTKFTVTITATRNNGNVTVTVPALNFQTGPFANADSERDPNFDPDVKPPMSPFFNPGVSGGYLYTVAGELPLRFRPDGLVPVGTVVASSSNNHIPFHYIPSPDHPGVSIGVDYLAPPVPGYTASIDHNGGLAIAGNGSYANLIPAGSHSLLPFTITYPVGRSGVVIADEVIDPRLTVIATSPIARVLSNNIRNSHVNAIYDEIVAECWTSNAKEVAKEHISGQSYSKLIQELVGDSNANLDNGKGLPIDAYIAVGKITRRGNGYVKELGPKVNISTLSPYQLAWDTAIAINPHDPKNIVASYGVLNLDQEYQLINAIPWVAVSHNGGQSWDTFPTQYQDPPASQGFGENRGVSVDKYGHFWYLSTTRLDNSGTLISRPYLMWSVDHGRTWDKVWEAPLPLVAGTIYDFPQFCFGCNEEWKYGIYLCVDVLPTDSNDVYITNFFLPISMDGILASGIKQANLTRLVNTLAVSMITAADDGRVWQMGAMAGFTSARWPSSQSSINDVRLLYKSPGPITDNYAGPFTIGQSNLTNINLATSQYQSLPVFGYFANPQSIIYDQHRKVLYAFLSIQTPIWSQNVTNYLLISGNNGATWSSPIFIGKSSKNNRGFGSMALDSKAGHLSFSWYDGRVDISRGIGLQYYGAVIGSDQLNLLVKSVAISNPTYHIPELVEKQSTYQDQASFTTYQHKVKKHHKTKPHRYVT